MAAIFLRSSDYFNPHPREGGDLWHPEYGLMRTVISIHTPAKGVTLVLLCIPDRIAISIHTPAKGVTVCSSC